MSGTGFDEVDWAEIYSDYLPRVRGYVRGRVPPAWVEDTAQDTFVRAFRSRHRFDDSRPVWPWLVTIARRACIETCRAHPLEAVSFDNAAHEAVAPDDPYAELERRLQAEAIAGALNMVSPRHRHLLVSYEVQGRPFGALADEERISRQALKSVLCRARDSFRTHYSILAQRRGLAALPVVGPLVARLRRWRRAFGMASLPIELASVVVVGVGATALLVGVPVGPHAHTAVAVGAGAGAPAVAEAAASRQPADAAPELRSSDSVHTSGETTRAREPRGGDAGSAPALRAAGDADLVVTPSGSTATVRLDWDDPTGPSEWTTSVTLDCQEGVWELACSLARAVPGQG